MPKKSAIAKNRSVLTKTKEEIEIMKKAGDICAKVLRKVLENTRAGATGQDLDKLAQNELQLHGATPSFMTVEGYRHAICTTINEQIVHGIPTARILAQGDIVGIDIGALYNGYHSDMALTVPIGNVSAKTLEFLETGRRTLQEAIKKTYIGKRIGDISSTIQKGIEGAGYSTVKSLTGHGIGRQLHEEPMIPGFGREGTGPTILENMVLAIEVIYTEGAGEVKLEADGWTISSVDGGLGGLFEKTVAVTKDGPIVLTPY